MRAKHFLLMYEAQQELFEVEMSPSNLKRLASQIPGVQVGMEFEMVVPNAQSDDEDDFEYEPDYDYDERADDIDDIVRFFGNDDDYVGQTNGPRELERLEEELREMFSEYMSEQILDNWRGPDGREFFADWVKNNVDSDEVAEFAETPNDLFGEKQPSKEDYEKFTKDQWEDEGSYYQEAYDAFHEELMNEGDFNERAFLRDVDITNMSDVARRIRGDIGWPFFMHPGGSGDGESVEAVGDDFSNAIGKRVYTSTSYHGAQRGPDAYSLEPDSSIDASSGEAGLEFISPPMSVDEMFEDLKKVKEWADERGCYTNRSTGLHINVSVPDYSLDKLDYVKLAVLIGDKYILDQFGRLSNSYAKSALEIIKDRAKDNEDVDRLLKQLKGNVETIASKILHSGRTDKFTSINTKDGYVEFRSAGGDWLDKNFDKIENTILRNIVALDAACDPNKYKKEYVKGLYKLLKPKDPKSEMGMFARYMSGEITRSEYANSLESTRKSRFREQGIRILQKNEVEENDWEVTYDDGTKQDTIYIANTNTVPTEEAAFNAAKKFKPQWFKPNTVDYITVKPYQFDEALNELTLYRADYSYKQTAVVAKNEEQAREYIKTMDPEWFAANPGTEIEITDENETSKSKLNQMNDWTQNKLEKGKEWLARPKIWIARGTPSEPAFSSRYYIAAKTRDEVLEVLNRLDSGFGIQDLYINDTSPSQDSYAAYKNAQEDLIRQQDEERANRQAAQDETIDVSNLKGYRVSNANGFMYVVAENGGEAAEIANKMDPEKFPNVEDSTVQDAGSIGAETLIRGMYARQQAALGSAQPSTPKFEVLDRVKVVGQFPSLIGELGTVVQVSPNYDFVSVQLDNNTSPSSFPNIALKKVEETTPRMAPGEQMYLVTNTDTGHEVRLAADSGAAAIYRAFRNDPQNFPGGNSNTNITVSELRTPSPAQEEPQYKMYNVIGSNSSEHVAARTPGEAQRIAMILYPQIGDILSVANSGASAELAASRYQRHQEDIARLNARSSEQQYTGYRVTGSNSSEEIIAARTPEEAENIARLLYPNLGENLSVSATDMPPLAASLRYRYHQENIARLSSSPNDTHVSGLRYYRVTRQDTSGRADVAASGPEDAMNRVRQNNPTWRDSPLRAELL